MFSRTSRILLVVALLAAGAYLLVERPHERKADQNQTTSERLASFDMASIDSIMIERPQDTVRFTKADSLWRMIDPLFDTADPGAIGTLLDALDTAEINRNLGPETDLSPYGLDHPTAVITLSSAHRVVLEVAVGKNTVDNAWCYAREGNGDVLLVPTDVHHSSTLPVDAYRDHRVANFQLRDVDSYTVISDQHGMSWARHSRGWINTESMTDTIVGDSVGVESVLRRLRGLRVASFGAADDHEHQETGLIQLEGPVSKIKMRTPIADLSFARVTDGQWRVSNSLSGRVVMINDDVSDLFAHTVTELRDRRLLQFDPAVTQRINFAAPTASGELVRMGGRWSFPNPALGRVDAERVADFVRSLRALKWSEPGSDAARSTGRVEYRIEILDGRGTMIDQLTAGPLDESTLWVNSRSSHGTWLVENARLDEVASRFARLKQR